MKIDSKTATFPHDFIAPQVYFLIGRGRLARHLEFYVRNLETNQNQPNPLVSQGTFHASGAEFCESSIQEENSFGDLPTFFTLSGALWISVPSRASFKHSIDSILKSRPSVLQAARWTFLLAIKDDTLKAFLDDNFELYKFDSVKSEKTLNLSWVHFSGSFQDSRAYQCHPLMSFGHGEFYPLEVYQNFAFALDSKLNHLKDLFPDWNNPFFHLNPKHSSTYYHALCVMGGNFPALINEHLLPLAKEAGIPENAWKLYLETSFSNWLRQGATALSGPLVRKDQSSLFLNREALKQKGLYQWEKLYATVVELTHQQTTGDQHENFKL